MCQTCEEARKKFYMLDELAWTEFQKQYYEKKAKALAELMDVLKNCGVK